MNPPLPEDTAIYTKVVKIFDKFFREVYIAGTEPNGVEWCYFLGQTQIDAEQAAAQLRAQIQEETK